MTRISIFAAALALSTAACAETRIYVSGVPYLCDESYHSPSCRKDWRTINRQKVRQREPEVRAWQHEERPLSHCQPVPVAVVGTEHLSVETAETAAQKAWMDYVRHEFGEIYMNLEKAHRLKKACTRSSTGDSLLARSAEKLVEGSSILTRCKIVATPCKVEPEEVGK